MFLCSRLSSRGAKVTTVWVGGPIRLVKSNDQLQQFAHQGDQCLRASHRSLSFPVRVVAVKLLFLGPLIGHLAENSRSTGPRTISTLATSFPTGVRAVRSSSVTVLSTACAICRRYVNLSNRNSRSGFPVSNESSRSFDRTPHPCCYDRIDRLDRRVVPDSLLGSPTTSIRKPRPTGSGFETGPTEWT